MTGEIYLGDLNLEGPLFIQSQYDAEQTWW